ncbi:hypothetical protein D7030_11350 [Flavobacteriaceae bacterium AU392]|nr:hypothetical protein D1817_13320 [Flavobacteriaceae bacterium]RKM82755.1 hypothetical protein D7030_11350 [Flavobacteriaceae bacterium AU392]
MEIEYKTITDEELIKVIDDHQLWRERYSNGGKRANLSFHDLSKNNFPKRVKLEKAILVGADFKGIDLIKADLSMSKLKGSNFTRANLEGVDFKGADLTNSNLSFSNLTNAIFRDAFIKSTILKNAVFKNAFLPKLDLEDLDLNGTNLSNANLSKVNLTGANLIGADLTNADIREAYFGGANLRDAKLTGILYLNNELQFALNVPKIYLQTKSKNIENEAEIKIKRLEEELTKKNQQLEEASITDEEINKIEIEKAKLNLDKQKFQKEKDDEAERKTKTSKNIEETIESLKKPNTYLNSQIKIQYSLCIVYLLLVIFCIIFFIYYVYDNYSVFRLELTKDTSTIQWIFYVSPILISFTLVITFINQINNRLKNIFIFHERKRYVDSIDGSLNAVLKINNDDDARGKILNAMDKILEHTIKSSEKMYDLVNLDEKEIKDPIDIAKEIKSKI